MRRDYEDYFGDAQINCSLYSTIGGRKENEDAVSVTVYGDNLVAVLTDGLGGQGDGRAASDLVCRVLAQCGSDGVFPTCEAVAAAFVQANEALLQKQQNNFHMRTTAVYFCLNRDRAIWAHIGDSRLYHICGDKICDCTLDHSAAQLAVFMGNIRRENIPKDPGRNRLIRVMGAMGEKPDVHEPVYLDSLGRHAFLLCSDGLWEYLSDEEIVQVCRTAPDARSCMELLRSTKELKSPPDCDNNSAIVIYVGVS